MLDEGMTLLPKMKEDDCLPDSITYAILLRALLGKSENDKVENLLHEMIDSGLLLQQQNKVLYIYPFACTNKPLKTQTGAPGFSTNRSFTAASAYPDEQGLEWHDPNRHWTWIWKLAWRATNSDLPLADNGKSPPSKSQNV
ncbi:hypothetical protein K1719_007236 [Acacia pycnantha]|nr:hypothetical protein K1719_007236 [Acacia pycnantha]